MGLILINNMNKKGQFFQAFFVILIIIFFLAMIVYFLTAPKQNPTPSKNISPIILQNNSNYTAPIRIVTNRNATNVTKPKPYNEYKNLTLYPDKRLVQGSILTTNKSIICVSGYSSTVRNVPLSVRKHILYQYGLTYPPNKSLDIEIDHWVALENSGGNSEDNLWVMYAPYYHWKDNVENLVHRKLCSTNMTVDTATGLMWIWYDIYKNNSIINDYINE